MRILLTVYLLNDYIHSSFCGMAWYGYAVKWKKGWNYSEWTHVYSKIWIQANGFISRIATTTVQYDNDVQLYIFVTIQITSMFNHYHIFVTIQITSMFNHYHIFVTVYWPIENSLRCHCIFICICLSFLLYWLYLLDL